MFSEFFRIFGVTEVLLLNHLLQTVLFLTDSVFDALLACFNESMDCIGGYKPWGSWSMITHKYRGSVVAFLDK